MPKVFLTSKPMAQETGADVTEFTHSEVEDGEMILSLEGRQMFELINCVFLSSAIGLLGIVANMINILIFFRQGLSNTVNISLFGMAISDLCSLITLEWLNICLNPLFEGSSVPWVTPEVQYLTAGWPHVCFTRITCCITAYVTAERCLCITLPLRVRQIITPTRTKVAICSFYLLMILLLVPEYATANLDWAFYPPKNRTMLRLVFTNSRSSLEGAVFVLNATLALVSFVAVTSCTAILVWKLKSVAEWRKKSTFENQQSESLTVRDKRTIGMIVIIAGILIICLTPGTALLLITFFEPEFSITGKYRNVFIVTWSFGLLFDSVNASVNIILYYRMSTKFRHSFHQIFSRCKKEESTTVLEGGSERSNTNVTFKVSCERSDSETEEAFDMTLMPLPQVRVSPQMTAKTIHSNGYSMNSLGKRQLTPKLRDKIHHKSNGFEAQLDRFNTNKPLMLS